MGVRGVEVGCASLDIASSCQQGFEKDCEGTVQLEENLMLVGLANA